MEDGETSPAARSPPYLPHELLVTEILARLPVSSLLRFRRVCKAWRDTISGIGDDGPSSRLARAHLRHHRHKEDPIVLIAPLYEPRSFHEFKIAGLYMWDHESTATLVHPPEWFPPEAAPEVSHGLAHCDGLVLVPTEAAVRVLNPATGRILTLPWSPRSLAPRLDGPPRPSRALRSYQSFGLGHDPRSGAYKVARFFYTPVDADADDITARYTPGMELFTIGADGEAGWRETAVPPPYPVMVGIPGRAPTFFKGSLLWTIDENHHGAAAPGFLRLSLEDESFSVTPPPPPPPYPDPDQYHHCIGSYTLGELRGELCVSRASADGLSVELWMCGDLDPPRWDCRHVVADVSRWQLRSLRPVAALDDGILFFPPTGVALTGYDVRTRKYLDDMARLYHDDMRYRVPGVVQQQELEFDCVTCDVIPYVPSLVPI